MGAVINQRGAARQAKISWERDQIRYNRDRQREDAYRLFDARKNAYTELYNRIGKTRRRLVILARDPDSEEHRKAARAARNEYWEKYAEVRLIGSPPVFVHANTFLGLFDQWIEERKFDSDEFAHRLQEFTDAVRVELGAGDTRD